MSERASFTITEFCERNGISRGHYFNLRAEGKGPREIKAGRKRLISREAELDWHRAMEAEPTAPESGTA